MSQVAATSRTTREMDGTAAAARFTTDFVPAFLKRALVPGDGPAAVLESLDGTGPVTTLCQCRTIFTLAHLHLATGRADLLDAALRIHGFASAHLKTVEGGYRSAVSADGQPLADPVSRTCRSYDQSFALMALVTLRRASPTMIPANAADALWDFVERRLIETETGALFDDDRGDEGSSIRSHNPHMHMFEALLQAFEMTGEDCWLERADRFVALAQRFFVDAGTGAVREFAGRDLGPLPGPQGRRCEPGHQFEWAWLLRRYAALGGQADVLSMARRLQSFAETHGVRSGGPMHGALYDALDDDGTIVEATHLLWPQTEAGKLYAALLVDDVENAGSNAAALKAKRAADLVFARYFAPDGAIRWVNRLDGEGRVVWNEALTRLLYHVALFVTEGGRAGLWKLDGSGGHPIPHHS
ncbi:AGE family epimerase/isomerase [Fulvimarina sp. MAC3]|uniref:AGE family epimerase/isomerase n=1 Tax=Fulvimarina sp. MAC3 TaxID=3148887 RepID=UPI0031FD0990